jgi:hypothetical protein
MFSPNVILLCLLSSGLVINAQTIDLGTAGTYGVFGAQSITNTGLTIVNGNIAVNPGSSITGFPPGIFTGVESDNDAVSLTVHNDATTAFNTAQALTCNVDLTGTDLAGLTLTPGVYCFSSTAALTGQLTLDAQGNADSQFVFKVGSSLTVASGSQVLLINGTQACAIFWATTASATLNVGTSFIGNILAGISITLGNAVTSLGGLYGLTGSVTLIDDNITRLGSCGVIVPPGISSVPTNIVIPPTSSSSVPAVNPTGTPTTAITTTGVPPVVSSPGGMLGSTTNPSAPATATVPASTSPIGILSNTFPVSLMTISGVPAGPFATQTCTADNCLCPFQGRTECAQNFCALYTVLAGVRVPCFVPPSCGPSQLSSACSCIVAGVPITGSCPSSTILPIAPAAATAAVPGYWF